MEPEKWPNPRAGTARAGFADAEKEGGGLKGQRRGEAPRTAQRTGEVRRVCAIWGRKLILIVIAVRILLQIPASGPELKGNLFQGFFLWIFVTHPIFFRPPRRQNP